MDGLLDTSIFVAREQGRALEGLPEVAGVSVITLAELQIGVLVARDAITRARRMRTVQELLLTFEPLPIDGDTALEFAEIVGVQRREGRRVPVADALIAATARRHRVPLFTQDRGFQEFEDLEVVLV